MKLKNIFLFLFAVLVITAMTALALYLTDYLNKEASVALIATYVVIASLIVVNGYLLWLSKRNTAVEIYQISTSYGDTIEQKFAFMTMGIFILKGIPYSESNQNELMNLISENFSLLKSNFSKSNPNEPLYVIKEEMFIKNVSDIILEERDKLKEKIS